MGSRGSGQSNQSSEGSSPATRIEALLDQVEQIDLTAIADQEARAIVGLLLNLVEDLRGELKKAQQEIAYLRERLGWRQGGGGKPGGQPGSAPSPQRHSARNPGNEPSGPSSARSTSTGKCSWMWIERRFRRMRKTRATKPWWCKSCAPPPRTCGFSGRSSTRRPRASADRRLQVRCRSGTTGSGHDRGSALAR